MAAMGASKRRGFTFIELLIAATMISILFVGLAAHLQGGMAVWKLATTTTAQRQRERVAFERFARDLANAFVYDARELSQPAPQFGTSAARWFTVSARNAGGTPAVRIVTYECGRVGDAVGLWRTSQSVGEARAGRDPARELLLPDCDALSIRYAYLPAAGTGGQAGALEPLAWLPEWQSGETQELPKLLEASVHCGSGRAIQRMLSIPVGVLKTHQG